MGVSILAIAIAALVCGLMTLLPDRTQGTLAFFAERGVSASWILRSKLAVWWVALLVMIIPLLVMRPDIWSMLKTSANPPYNNLPDGTDAYLLSAYAHNSPLLSAFGFLIGIFTIGALAAAWIRRPILATVAGIGMMLVWFFWYGTLMDCRAPKGFTAYLPVTLLGLGIPGFGQRTLLQQATWRSRVCQVSWVLLVAFVGMQSFFHFRAHEVPDVSGSETITSLAASLPVSTTNRPSTWNGQGRSSAESAAYLDSIADDPELAAGLVQPPAYWGASSTFQAAISTLRLEDPDCDLDAAIKHLHKWHLVGEHLAQNSRDEDGWVNARFGKRVVLSAIRQWANHPNQTLERMDAAIAHKPVEFPAMSGARVIARQHADTQRMLETGMAQDTGRPQHSQAGLPARWILTFTGEKERTRRLIDYYFSLSANTHVSQSPYSGIEFDHWAETSRSSVATFGVSLPWSRLNVRQRGQFELAWTAETVTRIVLRLQAWRLKHGSFPTGFAELFAQTEQFNIHDYITNTAMQYEPGGFERPLLAQHSIIIPAHQPLLYSEGISEPRGIEVSNVEEPDNSTGQMRTVFRYQSRNAGAHHPSHMFNPVPQVTNRAVQPNAIRFSVLGEVVDEDSLWRSKAAPDDIETSSNLPPDQSSTMGAGAVAPNVSVPAEAPAPEAKHTPSQDIN